jgi:hypothetical protein
MTENGGGAEIVAMKEEGAESGDHLRNLTGASVRREKMEREAVLIEARGRRNRARNELSGDLINEPMTENGGGAEIVAMKEEGAESGDRLRNLTGASVRREKMEREAVLIEARGRRNRARNEPSGDLINEPMTENGGGAEIVAMKEEGAESGDHLRNLTGELVLQERISSRSRKKMSEIYKAVRKLTIKTFHKKIVRREPSKRKSCFFNFICYTPEVVRKVCESALLGKGLS